MSTLSAIQPQTITQPQPVALAPATGSTSSGSTFGAVLDAINPLQHIPIVSSIFRASQGSSISPVSQIVGDTLYGGLVGGAISSLVSSIADVAVKGVTGKGIGEHVVATIEGDATTAPVTTTVANVPATAKLVADAPSSVPNTTKTDPVLAAKVNDAVSTIYRFGAHPERVAAQYQRAQTLDIGNKILLKHV